MGSNQQLRLFGDNSLQLPLPDPEANANKELPVHRWVEWIAGFSGSFVQAAIRDFLPNAGREALIVDPFAGVGTTLVEAQRAGIDCIGFEINPYACLVACAKLRAPALDLPSVLRMIEAYRQFTGGKDRAGADETDDHGSRPTGFKSRVPFFSPAVEQQALLVLEFANSLAQPLKELFLVAFASVMVKFSNYTYEPSLSTRPGAGKPLIESAPVVEIVSRKLEQMACDIEVTQGGLRTARRTEWAVHRASFFDEDKYLGPGCVDLVVTSPPYVNNYHYVRNTRPQLFWTALVHSTRELKTLEEQNFGKFWQTVRGRKAVTLEFAHREVERQITALRGLNSNKGVYGGSGWANYVATYVNDLNRLCLHLARLLKPGGVAVVVIGNSVIQGIEIRVPWVLSDIAGQHGLATERLEELRSRVGSSIVDTGARTPGELKQPLYDYGVILRQRG